MNVLKFVGEPRREMKGGKFLCKEGGLGYYDEKEEARKEFENMGRDCHCWKVNCLKFLILRKQLVKEIHLFVFTSSHFMH